jgi:hypothetical protein
MAEIFRINGFAFFMPSNDHEPAHVHVRKAEFKVKIDISGDQAKVMGGATITKSVKSKPLKLLTII